MYYDEDEALRAGNEEASEPRDVGGRIPIVSAVAEAVSAVGGKMFHHSSS